MGRLSTAPPPVAAGPYGLQRCKAGVYLHASGRYILKTDGWDGPRGGTFSLWEAADWEDGSGFTVDGWGGYRTLREKTKELDKLNAKESTR